MMTKLCMLVVLLLGMAWGADYHWSFEKQMGLRPYPKDAVDRVSLVPDAYSGSKALALANVAGKNTSAYSFIRLPRQAGLLNLKFHHKMSIVDNAPKDFTLSLFFNREGGGQGSAGGSQRLRFEGREDWTLEERSIPVPAEAVAAQVIFGVANGSKTLYLDDVRLSFVPDEVTFAIGEEATLAHFYELDRPATVQTEVRLTVGHEGLRVAFLNQEPDVKSLAAVATRRDDMRVFSDDCNELFIFDFSRGRHWQFAFNAKGALVDGERTRKQEGDPWRFSPAWNSNAKSKATIGKEGYETVIDIPWSDLGIVFKDGLELGLDFCRERKIRKENSHWNCGGFFGDTGTYALFKVANGTVSLKRHRTTEALAYAVKRARPQFEALLQKGVPGNITVGSWTDGYSKPSLPKVTLEKIGEEGFVQWQENLMNAWGAAHMDGPFFPWAKFHIVGKLKGMEKYHQKWNMRYPFFTYNSTYRKRAIAEGARFVSSGNTHVSPVDPAVNKVMVEMLRGVPNWGAEYEVMKRVVSFVEGPDEPTNAISRIFTISGNPEHAAALKELSETIRRETGFGKYGLPDDAVQADEARPFERIAFLRWWNKTLQRHYAVWREESHRILPGIPFKAANNNTTAGCGPMDYSMMAEVSDILGVDPYPTSTTPVFDHARAIYHTGFSVRLLRDLAPKIKVHATLQGFVYHSGRPGKAELNEWASQALKNGADGIVWYDSHATREMFPEFVYMMNLSKMIAEMDRIRRPDKTVTGILHSDYDMFALNDNVLNPAYSLYVVLGEQLKSNFRFVSPSGIANGTTPLDGLKLLYVPRGTYTTPELTEALKRWVASGGTLVAFDPRFQVWNIDGSPVAGRDAFVGAQLGAPKKECGHAIQYGAHSLNLAENRHIPLPTGFAVEGYTLTNLAPNVRPVATYRDGTPAAILHPYGKGKVISFAVQPFGNASLSLKPEKWLVFFREQARVVGEKTGLPIWDFTLPEAPESIHLNPIL